MTAHTQDTISTHPLAGLLKTAATSSIAERSAGSESVEVFGEVLDALAVATFDPEIEPEQIPDAAPQLQTEAGDGENSETEAATPSEHRNDVDIVDGIVETAKPSVTAFPYETQGRLPDPQGTDKGDARLSDPHDRRTFSFVNSTDSTEAVDVVSGRETLSGEPGLNSIDEGVVEAKVHVSVGRDINRTSVDSSEVETTLRLDDHPNRAPSTDVESRDVVADADLIPSDDTLARGLVRTAPLADTGILQQSRTLPQSEGPVDKLEADAILPSGQINTSASSEKQLGRPNVPSPPDQPVQHQQSAEVEVRAALDETVDAEHPRSAKSDQERKSEDSQIKLPANNSPAQPWQNSAAVLGANQEAFKVDIGFSSLGDFERGYAELPKLDSVQTSVSSTTFTTASTAQYASQQIARVAQSQPGGPVELALNPEELGRVKLTFTSHENTLVVTIVGERADTIDLMRRHIDSLSQEFKNIGYSNVSFSFSHNENGGADGGSNSDSGSSRSGDGASVELHELELSTDENVQTILSQTGLDIRI